MIAVQISFPAEALQRLRERAEVEGKTPEQCLEDFLLENEIPILAGTVSFTEPKPESEDE